MSFFSRRRAAVVQPELPFAELHGGGSRVTLIPSLGGKISGLELGGRQWLWTSDVIAYAPPVDGASYVETADTGGYDECFPTVGACRLPSYVKAFGNLELPDHGELWAQPPDLQLRTSPDGQSATTLWSGRRMPYLFGRTVRVAPAGEVVMDYEVRNDGKERLPFLWSSHPLLPLTPDTRLELPHDARVRVYAEHGISLGGKGAQHRWPNLRVAGTIADFSHPAAVAKKYACKLFLDVPPGPARVAVREGAHRLTATFDAAEVPHFGLWLNHKGWTPFRRGEPYRNMAFEPCIGAPDTLDDALGAWQSAAWLEPGETRGWTLTWRGETLDADEGAPAS